MGCLAVLLAALALVLMPRHALAVADRHAPTVTLRVSPVGSSAVGSPVTLDANTNFYARHAQFVFYDGRRVLGRRPLPLGRHGSLTTTALTVGRHVLAVRVIAGRSTVAFSNVVAFVVHPAASARYDPQSIVVTVPPHKMGHPRPPRKTGVLGEGQGRGGHPTRPPRGRGTGVLAFTGFDALWLLVLGGVLLALGWLLYHRGRIRRRLFVGGWAGGVAGAAAVLALAQGSLFAGPAAAADPPPPPAAPSLFAAWPDPGPRPALTVRNLDGTVVATPWSAHPGAAFSITATGFRAAETVLESFDGAAAGTAVADPTGGVVTTYRLPVTAAPGHHQLQLTGAQLVAALDVDVP